MANQPNRRRRHLISQPGHIGGMSRDELRNRLLQDDVKELPAASGYVMKEVKPVQECGHSGSPIMNITEPEGADENHPSSPISEHGQKGRNHYKISGSNPVSDEHCPGQISETEKRQNELVCLDGPGGTQESEEVIESNITQGSKLKDYLPRQQNQSLNQSERGPATVPIEHDLKNAKECKSQTNEEDSYVIPSSELSFEDPLKDILMSQRSVRDSSRASGKLEELITSFMDSPRASGKLEGLITSFMASHYQNLPTKPSIPNLGYSQSESIKALLQSIRMKAFLQNDPDKMDNSFPSWRSFILSLTSGKNNSFDQMTRHLSSLENEISAILKAECCDPHCSKSRCRKVQQCMANLHDFNVPVTDLTEEEQRVLDSMQEHCQSCQHFRCPLYWCQKDAFNGMSDPKEISVKMKQLVEHGYHGNFLNDFRKEHFAPFLPSFPLTSVPRESEDWCGLCRLEGAKNTIWVRSTMEDNGEYWILKKCQMFESHSQMELYEKLRHISPKGMAQHLWMVFCPDSSLMAVCMKYEEFSLYERLQESPFKDLRIVVRMMHQLIDTTRHLHEKGILYLNWSSKNIVYSTPEHYKLTNFTCSALKSRIDEDLTDISRSLPRHLLAPEMLQAKPEVDEKTDIWGLGCLIKEILSGQPVWYEHIHELDHVLHKKIMEDSPRKPRDCLDLFVTFKACWERERSMRPSLEELEMLLIMAKDSTKHR